jgi:hypothetical protein
MMAAWRKRLSRLSEMSWDELSTRTRQELSKRLEWTAYRAGRRPMESRLPDRAAAQGTFFFSPDQAPQLATLLRDNLNSEVSEIVQEAEDICAHRFHLLGYKNVEYGEHIDWHLDAVHGKRAPMEPWFKIPFLDFDKVGDHKVTWELNRHQHFVILAKAWHFANDDRKQTYIDELLNQWASWQVANPYPIGINWGSSLEVAFRSLSWIWVHRLLANCPAIPTAFEAELVRGLALNAGYIERYLSTYFSPNTHLLGEALALFFVGTLYPQIPSAKRWQQKGWRIMLAEAERQVRPDGVYFEQALYYHVYALDFFLHFRLLASLNGFVIPADLDAKIQKMAEVIETLSQAGPAIAFGDDDGGRLFNPHRNRPEHLSDPLALCALTFAREDFKCAANLTEEAVWLFGKKALELESPPGRVREEPRTKAFCDGGIYVMADASTHSQMLVDAGPQGTGHSGHGHADALSISLSLGGRPCLVDSGSYCYISHGNERNAFRGTAAHNTLQVDGLDQAVPNGPFSWTSIPAVRAEKWIQGKTFSLFVGSHNGYERLADPVVHRRLIFHLHGGFWLVRDLALGKGSHSLETFWHFAPDFALSTLETGFIAECFPSAPKNGTGPGTRLGFLTTQREGWSCEQRSGYISYAYGAKQAAPVVRISAVAQLPAESATILPVLRLGEIPGNFIEMSSVSDEVRGYQYEASGLSHYVFFSDQGKVWNLGSWSSDAKFLYCRVENHRLEQLIVCEGSSVTLDGNAIFEHSSPVDRLEWADRGGEIRIYSSDETAVRSFSRRTSEMCDTLL